MIICKSETELRLYERSWTNCCGNASFVGKMRFVRALRRKNLIRSLRNYIRSQGAIPSFKGYNGFPGSICASVNEELVHGIPGTRKLNEGDIISIDIGAQYQGYHGDSAWTYRCR